MVSRQGYNLHFSCMYLILGFRRASLIAQWVNHLPAIEPSPGSIPELGRSPGEGNGSPLQDSCLENPIDRGAWWATVHVVAKFCPTLATPLTVACQAPLSMGFSRQEYWSGSPCLPPGDLPNPGIEPASLMSPALAGGFFVTSTTWKAQDRSTFQEYQHTQS